MKSGHPLATLWPPTWPPKWPPLLCSGTNAFERVVIQKRYPPTYIWLEREEEGGLTLERQRHTGGTPILDPAPLRCAGTTRKLGWSKRWPTGWPMGGHLRKGGQRWSDQLKPSKHVLGGLKLSVLCYIPRGV